MTYFLLTFLEALSVIAVSVADASCGGRFTQASGTIDSPNYPSRYSPGLSCRWNIEVEEGHLIHLSFKQTFDVTSFRSDSFCGDDSVKVFDVLPDGLRLPRGVFCGPDAPSDVLSGSSTVHVEFTSDHSWQGRGFSLSWSTLDKPPYNRLEANSGTITSPGYPSSPYPGNVNQTWEIIVPFGQYIVLEINTLKLVKDQEETSCDMDSIEITDITADGSLLSRGRWCHSASPLVMKSLGSRLMVTFITDSHSDNNGKGFTASWTVESKCGGHFTIEKGLLASPNFPYLHGKNHFCKWTINGAKGHGIVLDFVHPFHMGDDCDSQYVKVFDVFPDGERYLKETLCGPDLPSQIESSTSVIDVEFKTTDAIDVKGFAASWSTGTQRPHQVLHGFLGILTSPNHPRRYHDNEDKRWEIIVPKGQHVLLQFHTFDVGTDINTMCHQDRMEILDVHPNNSLISLGQWCGSNAPPSMKSVGSRLFIDFHTDNDSNNNGQGFNASWSNDSTCGGNFTTDKGLLSSPDYPMGYGNNQFCKWTIKVTRGYLITLQFLKPFQLEQSSGCESDYVKVFDVGPNGGRYPRGTWCGSTPPLTLTSTSTVIDVEFKTDPYLSYKGFSAVWSKVAKPSHTMLEREKGIMTSPNYPSPYPGIVDQTWEIIVPTGQHIVLEFNTFNLGTKENITSCDNDRIEIFDVLTNNGPKSLGQWCGSKAPPSIKSVGSRLFVEFHTDNDTSNDGKGFNASWTTNSTCGGHFTTDTGLLSSPHGSILYGMKQFCKWTIQVTEGHAIDLQFMDGFTMENNCKIGFVQVFDILPNGERYLKGRWCGSNPPPSLISSTSKIDVEFQSSDASLYKGFTASWNKIVRSNYTLLYGDDRTIDWPSSYPGAVDHTWEIMVHSHENITLSFDSYDLGTKRSNSPLCHQGRIEVFGVFSNYSETSLRVLCGSGSHFEFQLNVFRMFLRLHTDTIDNGKGFVASWTTYSTCGGNVIGDGGMLSSPNYPSRYGDNQFCKWMINVTQGFVVRLEFLSPFQLENDISCKSDFVQVFDVLPSGKRYLRDKWCGWKAPSPFTSSSFVIHLEFRTDKGFSSKGFAASWSKSAKPAHEVLEGEGGTLSTNPNGGDKRWEIIVPFGQHIVLDFDRLVLATEEDQYCHHEMIEVFDVLSNDTKTRIGQWCGSTTPPAITSNGSRLVVYFHTNDTGTDGHGFNATWTAENNVSPTTSTNKMLMTSSTTSTHESTRPPTTVTAGSTTRSTGSSLATNLFTLGLYVSLFYIPYMSGLHGT